MSSLVGLMGSGKSTVGKLLAAGLGLPLIDSDASIESSEGMSARTVARQRGIDELHRIEAAVLIEALAAGERSVIAAAASTIEDPACQGALADPTATAVWLRASPERLAGRVRRGGHRPMVVQDEAESRIAVLTHQAKVRDPLFRAIADTAVEVSNRPPASVAAEILARIESA